MVTRVISRNLWLKAHEALMILSASMMLLRRYRSTVIRNLPQLQKLDNAVVQPDDMAEAMRRGVELVHPLERDTAYPPPQSMGYSQVCTGENE